MYVLELEYPGTWLDMADEDADIIQTYLCVLEASFYEANAALNRFEDMRNERPVALSEEEFLEQFRAKRRARMEIERQLDLESEADGGVQFLEGPGGTLVSANSLKAQKIIKQQEWAAGDGLEVFRRQHISISAKSYLFALDNFYKVFEELARRFPTPFGQPFQDLKKAFPDLIAVRNSLHHVEDRAIGQSRGKDIKLAPLNEHWFKSVDGAATALIGLALTDDEVGCTKADGEYGKVKINIATLQFVQSIFQQAINNLQWTGFPTHSPN